MEFASGVDLVFLSVFLLLGHFASSTQSPALAKPGCQESCGSVTIPFPFGIGAGGCFLNEWYEIVCSGNGTVPLLKKIEVEVLAIHLPRYRDVYGFLHGGTHRGTIEVILPIIYSNEACLKRYSQTSWTAPNLDGSPFFYDPYENIFFAVGCQQSAVINNTGQVLSGCTSECRGRNSSVSGNCSGYNGCCETAITSLALQEFGVNFMKAGGLTTGEDAECSFALLANETWLRPQLIDLNGLMKKGYVHGVLEWGISMDTDLAAQLSHICGSAYLDGITDAHGVNVSCKRIDGSEILERARIATFSCGSGYTGNPYLTNGCRDFDECADLGRNYCPDPDSCENTYGGYRCRGRRKTVKIVSTATGAGIGTILLLMLLRSSYKAFKRRREVRRKQKFFKRNGGLLLLQQLSSPEGNVEKNNLFNSKELEKATDNFNDNRILGKGGQGTVYKGMLTDGRIVAVKKSMAVDEGKAEQFINEVLILSQINHRNVVKLLGCCLETEVPLLVYEYIPNGTLYQYLHEPNEELAVLWDVRLRLATEVAGSLSYLHSAASMPIYHRDIKSTNILLDEKYRAKIADFGTSRSVSLEQTHVTTLVQGTFGYLDPEYFQSCKFTDKSDVYSFGVVLVELLTGQKPISSLLVQEGVGLATFFITSMEENRLQDILDPQVLQHAGKDEVITVANLAKRCLHLNGRKRPPMKEVAMVLEGIRKPVTPPGGSQRSEEFSEYTSSDQTSEWSESSNALLKSTCSEVIARADSRSDGVPLICFQTW